MMRNYFLLTILILWTTNTLSMAIAVAKQKTKKELRHEKEQAMLKAQDEHGRTMLMHAVISNNFEALNYILQQTIFLNARDSQGATALHHAIACQSSAMAERLLVNRYVNTALEDNLGRTPFILGMCTGNTGIVRLLMKYNACLDAALHFCVTHNLTEMIDLILSHEDFQDAQKRKKLLNGWDSEGNTALVVAALSENYAMLDKLLSVGANLDSYCANARTTFSAICESVSIEVLDYILNHAAVKSLGLNAIKALINNNIGNGTPFTNVLLQERWDVVDYFLQYEADITAIRDGGNTALHLAAKEENIRVLTFILNHPQVRNLDHQHYANFINADNRNSETALLIALKKGNKAAIELLINAGAHPHDRNKNNSEWGFEYETALQYACKNGLVATVELFLSQPWFQQLDLQQKNKHIHSIRWDKESPYKIAVSKGHTGLVEILNKAAPRQAINDLGTFPLIAPVSWAAEYEETRASTGIIDPQQVNNMQYYSHASTPSKSIISLRNIALTLLLGCTVGIGYALHHRNARFKSKKNQSVKPDANTSYTFSPSRTVSLVVIGAMALTACCCIK